MDAITCREPPIAGDEAGLLLGVLDRTRSFLAWKRDGLEAAGMRATLGPSAITLDGLEDDYFSFSASPGDTVDWGRDRRTAVDDPPERLFALWQEAVARSRANVAEALARGDMGQQVHISGPDGRHASLRRLVVDLIDEDARHNGHADLIRESVDGLVGEAPPERGE